MGNDLPKPYTLAHAREYGGFIRAWINQPSSLQPLRNLHGTLVFATWAYDDTWVVYPIEGDTISMQCPQLCLSAGWPDFYRRDKMKPPSAGA